MQYRTHQDGPLTDITVEPGRVVVTMTFDRPGDHTRLHSHAFPHWMTCQAGSARIVLDAAAAILRPGSRYLVEAHERHAVYPLESGTVLRCEHVHADIHPDKTDGQGIPLEWLDRLTDDKRLAA